MRSLFLSPYRWLYIYSIETRMSSLLSVKLEAPRSLILRLLCELNLEKITTEGGQGRGPALVPLGTSSRPPTNKDSRKSCNSLVPYEDVWSPNPFTAF
jgi:hypothetical protein